MAVDYTIPRQIRDIRNGDWFWISKQVWADDNLTPSDKVVYGSLAYYANREQTSYPSFNKLAEFTNLSQRQIIYSIKKLETHGYLSIERKKGKLSIYYLLKISGANFAPHDELLQNVTVTTAETTANAMPGISPINNIEQELINNTLIDKSIKGTLSQFGNPEINLCIEELTKLLGNTPTKVTLNRYAAKRLIKNLGSVDRVLAALNYAFKIREEDKYAPRIYNLMDLEEKLEHLKGYGRQKSTPRAINVEEGVAYLEGRKSSVDVD